MAFMPQAEEAPPIDQVITGVEDNTTDLRVLFGLAQQIMAAGADANQADLELFQAGYQSLLERGVDLSAVGLDEVANHIALMLAAGAQANAADLNFLPPEPGALPIEQIVIPPEPGAPGPADAGAIEQAQEPVAAPGAGQQQAPPGDDELFTLIRAYFAAIDAGRLQEAADKEGVISWMLLARDPTVFTQWCNEPTAPGAPLYLPYVHGAPRPSGYRLWNELIYVRCLWRPGQQPEAPGAPPGFAGIVPPAVEVPLGKLDIPPMAFGCRPLDNRVFEWAAIVESWFPDGLPMPGTPQFCAALSQLDVFAERLKMLLEDWIKENLTLCDVVMYLDSVARGEPQAQPGLLSTFFSSGIGGASQELAIRVVRELAKTIVANFALMARLGMPVVDLIRRGILTATRLASRLKPGCTSALAFVLLFGKWVFSLFKSIQIGTDAGLWYVQHVVLEFGPLEELFDQLIRWSLPLGIPELHEVNEAWRQGMIDVDLRDCLWRMHGLCPETYATFAMASAEHLTADEMLRVAHRNEWEREAIDNALKQRGWLRSEDRSLKQELFWELPTINDHLHWLMRNIDDRDYVQRFGLLDGFSTQQFINTLPGYETYAPVVETHGRDFWRAYGKDLLAQGLKPEYAANHYAAHWIQPSPEQMREFIYRLRPDPARNVRGFTVQDYERILAEQDYAPLARQWFVATVYRVPALTYIIGMYRQGIIDDDALKRYHQDLGYTAEDSDRFVGVDRVYKAQFRAERFKGWTPTAIASGFVTGWLDRGEALAKARQIGASDQEAADMLDVAQAQTDRQVWQRARSRFLTRTVGQVTQALAVGNIPVSQAENLLEEMGFPRRQAEGIVQAELAAARTQIVRQTVNSVRSSFHGGFIDRAAAERLLETAGIRSEKRREYLELWDIQNTPRRKQRSAAKIVNDLANGMIDTPNAIVRLRNLGYDRPDSLLFIADAQRQIIGRQAKAMAAAAKDRRTQAQMLTRLQQQAERQAKKLRAELSHSAPRSVLVKWLARGFIRLPEFRLRMVRLGYAPADILRYERGAPTEPRVLELLDWLKKGVIDANEYGNRIVGLGYTVADAQRFVDAATATGQEKETPSAP